KNVPWKAPLSREWYQIEQREQEDPDNIDEVPVESRHLHRHIVLYRGMPDIDHPAHHPHDQDTDDHMHGMKPGHPEIERKVHLRLVLIHLIRSLGQRLRLRTL